MHCFHSLLTFGQIKCDCIYYLSLAFAAGWIWWHAETHCCYAWADARQGREFSEVMVALLLFLALMHSSYCSWWCFFQVVEQVSCHVLWWRHKSHALFASNLFLHITCTKSEILPNNWSLHLMFQTSDFCFPIWFLLLLLNSELPLHLGIACC